MSLAEVEQARVHLTLPKESVFLDQQQPAKASVMVKLRAGRADLPAECRRGHPPGGQRGRRTCTRSVSVLDMDGNLLQPSQESRRNDGSEITGESLEVRQQIEHDLVAKISATLEPLLGPDRFRAGASVDCDLTSGEQQEETLDPAHSVMVSSQKTEDVTDRPASGGVPGTASNLPNPASRTDKTAGGRPAAPRTSPIRPAASIRHTRIPQGVIKRMSLAVLVDQNVQLGRRRRRQETGAGAACPRDAQDHQRSGGRRHRLQCRARRSIDRGDACPSNPA